MQQVQPADWQPVIPNIQGLRYCVLACSHTAIRLLILTESNFIQAFCKKEYFSYLTYLTWLFTKKNRYQFLPFLTTFFSWCLTSVMKSPTLIPFTLLLESILHLCSFTLIFKMRSSSAFVTFWVQSVHHCSTPKMRAWFTNKLAAQCRSLTIVAAVECLSIMPPLICELFTLCDRLVVCLYSLTESCLLTFVLPGKVSSVHVFFQRVLGRYS